MNSDNSGYKDNVYGLLQFRRVLCVRQINYTLCFNVTDQAGRPAVYQSFPLIEAENLNSADLAVFVKSIESAKFNSNRLAQVSLMSSKAQVSVDSESAYRKWRFSPLTNCQSAMFIGVIVAYSTLYLFFASHNYLIFLIMAG
uniref:Transmembrane protein n=1 Tax=Syphacia muris TaxID=451379 RepID=A0A0N5AT18_9BILA